MNTHNFLLLTDSYKVTHWRQYPPNTTVVSSYFESRGGKFDEVTFFGLQYYLKEYLAGQVVTREKIEEAAGYFSRHFGDESLFNRQGWEHILEKHGGRLPVRIRAVPEGTVMPYHNVLITAENTDPACWWLTNYIESLLVQTWYGSTVATLSRQIREMIGAEMARTGSTDGLDFKLHDFGFRGTSSVESAALGGAAHLINFSGTDTLAALEFICRYYQTEEVYGHSIPAAEHSTITSWLRPNEAKAYANMLAQYPKGLVAVVSDSYDIMNACEKIWGGELRDQVLQREGTLVVRPDSGEPKLIVSEVVAALGNALGFTVNEKGFKVLNPKVRVIQGDGVNYESIGEILAELTSRGWAAENVAFGMGSSLLQNINRDTQKFAFKCSAAIVDGQEREVFKDPVTDPGKKSKRGRQKLVFDERTGWETRRLDQPGEDRLVTVFEDGEIKKTWSFEEVRAQTALWRKQK
ncbi:MAG: nicotinate phosphoribosyltransferase [Bacteroidia bacterium]|nr:nicotinate phosphoribosyltransferase [Bacteroidia bacterium]